MATVAHRRSSAGGRLSHHSIKASRRTRPRMRMAIAATTEITPTIRTTSGARQSGATARNTTPSTTRMTTANPNRAGLCQRWTSLFKLRGLARPITPIRAMTTPSTGTIMAIRLSLLAASHPAPTPCPQTPGHLTELKCCGMLNTGTSLLASTLWDSSRSSCGRPESTTRGSYCPGLPAPGS